MTPFNHATRRIILALFAGILLFVCAGADVLAQRFQHHYGGKCWEGGYHGVQQLTGGGYSAVGDTKAGGDTCIRNNWDIYVIKTTATGAVTWAKRYDFTRADDHGTSIRELAGGGYIVTGYTYNGNNNDVVLLQLDVNGGVVRSSIFDTGNDDYGWDVIETTTGDPTNGTHVRDFVVAGYTGPGPLLGSNDGLLLRTTSAFAKIWAKKYNRADPSEDKFYALDEASLNVASGQAGDIAAVGMTSTFTFNNEVFAVRVNGNNGTVAAQNAVFFGGNAADEGFSIKQLRVAGNGLFPGDFAITGDSRSRQGAMGSEIFVAQMFPVPCNGLRGSRYLGDNGGNDDGGRWIQEVPAGAPAGLVPGNLIATGFTSLGAAPVTGKNVFLQEFTQGALALVGPQNAYGGTGDDVGWSVSTAVNNAGAETPGYIVCGTLQSPNLLRPGDPNQVYLIKTNTAKSSGCNEVTITFSNTPAGFTSGCASPVVTEVGTVETIAVQPYDLPGDSQLCYAFPQTREQGNNQNDGVAGVNSNEITDVLDGVINYYPDPVGRGNNLNIECTLRANASMAVTVSDLLGHIVYNQSTNAGPGNMLLPVNTSGWPSGMYLVKVVVGNNIDIRRIVIGN
jgi:hypothetical protein